MREIISLNLRPGVIAYTTLLNAYGVSGDVAAAHQVLHDMKAAGVQPNNITYSSLMAFHSQAGNVSRNLVSNLCSFLHIPLNVFVLSCKWHICLLYAVVAVIGCICRQGCICSLGGLHSFLTPGQLSFRLGRQASRPLPAQSAEAFSAARVEPCSSAFLVCHIVAQHTCMGGRIPVSILCLMYMIHIPVKLCSSPQYSFLLAQRLPFANRHCRRR